MNSFLLAALAGLLPAIVVILIARLPVAEPPEWAATFGSPASWRKLSYLATVVGLGSIVAVLVPFAATETFSYLLAMAMSTGVVGVAVAYSIFTDSKVRQVDRRILNWAMLAAGIPNVAYLATNWDPVTAITAAVVVLFGIFIYVFVFAIGASDARAFMLVGLAVVPPMGYHGFMWGTILTGLFFIAACFVAAVFLRRYKVSFPAVPLLLVPYWLVLVSSAYIFFGPFIPAA